MAFFLLFNFPLAEIPPMVLFLNIVVSSVALYRFKKSGYFEYSVVLPFLLTSIPTTFFSAMLEWKTAVLQWMFIIVLSIIALILLLKRVKIESRISLSKRQIWVLCLLIGVILGFLTGVMGIGGGLFLGPILLFWGLSSAKESAGACSAFVLLNSLVGFISHYAQGHVNLSTVTVLLLGIVVFIGAQIGSFWGTKKFSPLIIQRIFALIILFVVIRMAFEF